MIHEPGGDDAVDGAAGDWVSDTGHDGFSEIHEARIIATARKVFEDATTSISYTFVSGFFMDETRQEGALILDVAIPRPDDPDLKALNCTANPAGVIPDPLCAVHESIRVTATADSPNPLCQRK